MILNWTKDRVLTAGDLIILPGMNEVSDEKYLAVRGDLKIHLEKKALIEVQAQVTTKLEPETKKEITEIKSKTLKELPAREAEQVVSETFNLKTLGGWLKAEARDSVRVSIQNQIDSVEKYGEDKAKKKAEANKDKED